MLSFPTFSQFFHALWGYPPFPWQERLAEQAVAGQWPDWVTLPTGTGKTSILDIAVYALAKQATQPESKRTVPVRIVFAVNRRIVVDEAFERARSIAQLLKNPEVEKNHSAPQESKELPLFAPPTTPDTQRVQTLRDVAAALVNLSQNATTPLEAYPLRGGTFTDRSWARSPFQPLILSTTLDQLGSRLLFRGYGVTDYAHPIHSALLANDALLILDEAHTATAFSQTLAAISRYRTQARESLRLPFQTIQLTATPPSEANEPFRLLSSDQKNLVIAQRLAASKPFELHEVSGAKGTGRHKTMASAMAAKALEYQRDGAKRVLIVVNRVATAQALYSTLNTAKSKSTVELLTGRLRPLDRDRLVTQLVENHQLKSASPSSDVAPLILVATQTIEVGADFDFDALITELAPLDNLRQRFGRLNRYGRPIHAKAAIFAPEESLNPKQPDPIYGSVLPEVWSWLHSLPEDRRDFGFSAMEGILPTGEELAGLLAPTTEAPILLPTHLDILCQTSPQPQYSPDPSLFIHGPQRSFPEVGVVLRDHWLDADAPLDALAMLPPVATEAATIPLGLARAWLVDPERADDVGGDAPSAEESTIVKPKTKLVPLPVWRAREAILLLDPAKLLPGDILTLSPERWHHLQQLIPCVPEGNEDQFELAYLTARDRLRIRFTPAIRERLAAKLAPEIAQKFRDATRACFAISEDEGEWLLDVEVWQQAVPVFSALLAKYLPADDPQKIVWEHAAWTNIEEKTPRGASDWKPRVLADSQGRVMQGALLTNRSRVGYTKWPLEPEELGQQGDAAAEPISLAAHSEGVARRTKQNAALLPDSLAECLCQAALYHDLGKADSRFQAVLHRCPYHAVLGRELLAKSGEFYSKSERDKVYDSLGLPRKHFRHEAISAAIVALSNLAQNSPERELLLHLITSHHGRGRAFVPVIVDDNAVPVQAEIAGETVTYPGQKSPMAALADGVTDRFWQLTRRFGWWGLAYLETLLRLADQVESANPTLTDGP